MATKQIHDLPAGDTITPISEFPVERSDTTIAYESQRFFVGQLADQDTIKNPSGPLEVNVGIADGEIVQLTPTGLPAVSSRPTLTTNPVTTTETTLQESLDEIFGAIVPTSSLSPYIVGTEGINDFTTIQGAINQAVTDGASAGNWKVIIVKPTAAGYTENLSIPDGIFLVSESGLIPLGLNSGLNPQASVNILGNHTITGGVDTYTILKGFNFITTATGACFTQVGRSRLYVQDSFVGLFDSSTKLINVTNNNTHSYSFFSNVVVPDGTTGSIFSATVFTTTINMVFYNCKMDASATSSATINANITIDNCDFSGTALSLTGSSTNLTIRDSFVNNITSTSATAVGVMTGGKVVGTINWTAGQTFTSNYVDFTSTSMLLTGNFVKKFVTYEDGTIRYLISKLLDDYTGSEIVTFQNFTQTTNATPFVIKGPVLNANESYTVTGRVTAASPTHANMVGGTFSASARRAGGNIIMVGTPTVDVKPTGAGTFTVVADTGFQALSVEVTGEAATTYNWVVTFEYHKVLTDA